MQGDRTRRLILALDVPTMEEALELADLVGEFAGHMKVGLRLFTAEGPELVRALKDAGHGVFLDLKFHDIPNTVADAARSAVGLGVDFFTVHTPGGEAMLRAASDATRDEAAALGLTPPTVLGVTVLTSLPSTTEEVVARARTAWESVREALGPEAVIVTPGIRPSWSTKDDQARITTPGEAVAAGADHIVVGRPIRNAEDPREAARRIVEEMDLAEVAR
jgi:orotidine-5'-phosphate decarboxylase